MLPAPKNKVSIGDALFLFYTSKQVTGLEVTRTTVAGGGNREFEEEPQQGV